ncbi:hypothetical protein K437DRAFT_276784 [Tilletiaria anomala UBC 951]|uniref:Exonuclease V n=1 Tax=Tilletiaria anomala (strain ATCC 24038 / CBS 436.72 / UBC 951) TaxID=1037660 RepID=A0A066VD76_TILAU|nr:uncharacterized protein K437DRAFT_276784 [Tilletiaria anomala UBC 951]KDN36545.1 hypothetical protein K437DRAFT_276784 [Tilletiaria anomala UBC 951]
MQIEYEQEQQAGTGRAGSAASSSKITLDDREQEARLRQGTMSVPPSRHKSTISARKLGNISRWSSSITPPKSLQDHASRKGHLTVTELVTPSWCEFSFQYSILSLSYLPPSLRPASITTPQGTVIPLDQMRLEMKQRVFDQGKKVHAKLEKEIFPGEKVFVSTRGKEDEWALQMVRLAVAIKTLLDKGCSREIPVFGWVQDRLVLGIIDELERRPRYVPKLDQACTTSVNAIQTQTAESSALSMGDQRKFKLANKDEGEHPPSLAVSKGIRTSFTTSRQPPEGRGTASSISQSSSNGPQFTSQEEWKKAVAKAERERKVDARLNKADNRAKLSPVTNSKQPAPNEGALEVGREKDRSERAAPGIMSFFKPTTGLPAASSVLDPSDDDSGTNLQETNRDAPIGTFTLEASSNTKERLAAGMLPSYPLSHPRAEAAGYVYVLSDSKTRSSDRLPRPADYLQAKLQCMLYKRLLEGLLLGVGTSGAEGLIDIQPGAGIATLEDESVDHKGTPFTMSMLAQRLQLNLHAPLSDDFLSDAIPLCEGYGLHLFPDLESSSNKSTSPSTSVPNEPKRPRVCTLSTVFDLMAATLRDMRASAWKGHVMTLKAASGKTQTSNAEIEYRAAKCPIISDELALVFRRRGQGKEYSAKKRDRVGEAKEQHTLPSNAAPDAMPACSVKRLNTEELAPSTGDGPSPAMNVGSEPAVATLMHVEKQAKVATMGSNMANVERQPVLQLSLAVQGDPARISDHTITASDSPRNSQQRHCMTPALSVSGNAIALGKSTAAKDPSSQGPSKRTSFKEGSIIGIVTFLHDATQLDDYLRDVMAMWEGTRELRGVTDETVYRCSTCEFKHGCEWRAKKQDEHLAEKELRRAELERSREAEAQLAIRFALEKQDEEMLLAAQSGAAGKSQTLKSAENDEELWSQFEDIEDANWDAAESQDVW